MKSNNERIKNNRMDTDTMKYKLLDNSDCFPGALVFHAKTKLEGKILTHHPKTDCIPESCTVQWKDGKTQIEISTYSTFTNLLTTVKDKQQFVEKDEFVRLAKRVEELHHYQSFCNLPHLIDIENNDLLQTFAHPKVKNKLLSWTCNDWQILQTEVDRVKCLNSEWQKLNDERVSQLILYFNHINSHPKLKFYDFQLAQSSLILLKAGMIMKKSKSLNIPLVQHYDGKKWNHCEIFHETMPFRILDTDLEPEVYCPIMRCEYQNHKIHFGGLEKVSDDELKSFLILEKLAQ